MGWDEEDCYEYFYKNTFKDKLPGVDYDNDEFEPPYNELTKEQYEVVEKAYWHNWELERSHNDPYSTPR